MIKVLACNWLLALHAMHHGQGNNHFWAYIESLLVALLAQPSCYVDQVTALFSAALAPEQDPENRTQLTPEHLFTVRLFFELINIAKDNIMWWLSEQLHVPC
ncbi:hypothetical protein FRC12_003658 [Ceratobasidium sp. 428]|nr:hypothetical protein FRC12_003658 [Ceratobasidium sp. 428]